MRPGSYQYVHWSAVVGSNASQQLLQYDQHGGRVTVHVHVAEIRDQFVPVGRA